MVKEGHGGSTRGVVEHAVRLARQDDYDEIWCVIDTEILATNSTFESAVSLTASKGIRLAVSNPAFEYWYLLHLTDTNRAFVSVEQLITVLKTSLPDYEKGAGYLPPIFEHTETATSRAEAYRERHASPGDPYPHLQRMSTG